MKKLTSSDIVKTDTKMSVLSDLWNRIKKLYMSFSDTGGGDPENFGVLYSEDTKMHIYTHLIMLGLIIIMLLTHLCFQIFDKNMSVIVFLLYVISLIITFLVTKKELEEKYDGIVFRLKKKYNSKIHRLKREHDIATLEKTIRDGTQTLIKNAVEYFKIENIRNEMPISAAIQNLQLDKYGQIIELLADFSLILPDYKENQEIVQQEINHQIQIYEIDEKPFAKFLQRLTEKYIITVTKKIREKEDQNFRMKMKVCPQCAERIFPEDKTCKHCGNEFKVVSMQSAIDTTDGDDLIQRGYDLYRAGDFYDALRMFTIAIYLNPQNARAYYNRGIIHKKVDNQTQALEDLKAAAHLGHKKAQGVLSAIQMMDTQEWD